MDIVFLSLNLSIVINIRLLVGWVSRYCFSWACTNAVMACARKEPPPPLLLLRHKFILYKFSIINYPVTVHYLRNFHNINEYIGSGPVGISYNLLTLALRWVDNGVSEL